MSLERGHAVLPGLEAALGLVSQDPLVGEGDANENADRDGSAGFQAIESGGASRNTDSSKRRSRVVPRGDLRISTQADTEVWEVPAAAPTRYLSHDYFRYIGKFPPQIPREFLSGYSCPGDIVLDPMCGGGTALIEARLMGRPCIGIDVNPVSLLVSSVTTRALRDDEIEEARAFLWRLRVELLAQKSLPIADSGIGAGRRAKLADMHGHEKYFDLKTIGDLESYFGLIEEVSSKSVQDFLLVALLSELRTISHANVKKMNLELDLSKRTRKPLATAVGAKIEQMIRTNSELRLCFTDSACDVFEGEAAHSGQDDESVSLAIVHPPYMTNTAFSEATQLQLTILGISHKSIWRRELRARGSFVHEPDGVRKYIVGWNRILEEMYRVLKIGGHCAVVVGDGQVDYTRIPVGVISEELAKDIGFQVVRRARHKLNNHTGQTQSRKMRHQHILVLQK